MAFKNTLAGSIAALVVLTSAAVAQQNDWNYEASFYLFAPETKSSLGTPAGTIDGTLSFSDALSNLDMALMGSFGVSNGRWSFLLDYMYTDLSFGNSTPGPAFSGVNTDLKTQFLNGYAAYRVYETQTVQLDLAAGFRWFDTQTKLTLLPGAAPGATTTVDDNWIDPIIGARARFDLSERWSGTAFVDYGGFKSHSDTWQVLLTADYALNANWVLRFGYRYIEVNHIIDNNDFSLSQSGPILGATYRF